VELSVEASRFHLGRRRRCASPTAQAVEALTRRNAELIGSLELLAQAWRPQILAQVGQPPFQSMQGALDMLRVAEGHITPHGVWT
jgi:hypothetical protein